MRKYWNYYKIKWTAFFITIFILTLGLAVIYVARPYEPVKETPHPKEQNQIESKTGHYSNTAFSSLIEENLSELSFIDKIAFTGASEGHFTIAGTLSEPKRLATICTELEPFSMLLGMLKGKEVSLNGHLGEDDEGNGCFVVDTITFLGQTMPAGIATTYIEEYTALNDLLEVPVRQIAITESGITFKELPTLLQTVSYK